MKTFVNFLGVILLISMIQSCTFNFIRGNGNIVEKEIFISDYNAIRFSGGATIFYEQQTDAEPYLRVEIDENLLPLLMIESANGTLSIRNQHDVNISATKFVVYTNSIGLKKLDASGAIKMNFKNKLTTDQLNINVSGSGNIVANQIECDIIKIESSGSSSIMLSGTANELYCFISGSGKVKADTMIADNVYCEIAGSGDFDVYAKTFLKVSISGTGKVRYKGEPKIEKSISGMGKVININ